MLNNGEYDTQGIINSFNKNWCLLRYRDGHIVFGPKSPTPIPDDVAEDIINALDLVSEPCKLFKDEIIWKKQ